MRAEMRPEDEDEIVFCVTLSFITITCQLWVSLQPQ
jgi:hypothetical protein